MAGFLVVPSANGETDLTGAVVDANATAPAVISGLVNGTEYVAYRLSDASPAFTPVLNAINGSLSATYTPILTATITGAVGKIGSLAATYTPGLTATITGAIGVTVSSVTVGAFSGGEIPVTITTVETPNDTGSVYWVLVPTGQTAPSATQIRNGQNGLGGSPLDAGSFTWTASPPNVTIASGIDEFCDFYIVIDTGALSNVGSDTNFEVDSTASTLTSVTGTQTGANTADWGATSDEAQGTIFAAVRLATDGTLTKAEIENGTGNAVSIDTDPTPTADSNNGGSFTGLTASTNYRVDAFQRDEFGNETAVVTSAQFTTAGGGGSGFTSGFSNGFS